jgi:hypothetical protein
MLGRGEKIDAKEFDQLPVGSIIRNHKGEYGMKMQDGSVLRMSKEEAQKFIKEADKPNGHL